jgi:pyruvate/2-oxoglutarate dehydrogenase complex dihydrolipoamide dehydrogenase (E3) component
MERKEYDIIVIGAGSAGLSVSLGMHEFGFDVLLIDKTDKRIGGECLNDGCVPSKALIHIAKTVHEAKISKDYGLQVTGEVDFQRVREYIKKVQNTIKEHENAQYFTELGLDVELGTAKFLSENSIGINGKEYTAKKIVIATGSKPKIIPVKGIENVTVHTNETIFDIEELPKKMVIIGGGPIGCEFSQAFSRLGTKVSVIETGDRILSKEDPKISKILLKRLKSEGIDFYLESEIMEFTGSQNINIKQGKEMLSLDFDILLMGVGREVNFDDLDLEKAGIDYSNDGIKLDEYLQTTNKSVYVAGDAADQMNFSHGAEHQATTIIKNFLNPFKSKISYEHFSWVTFTDPEVATFGLQVKSLEEKGKTFERLELDFDMDDRAVIGDYRYGKLILFVEKTIVPGGDRKILGGSMIAPHAGEIIQELVLANSAGMGTKALFDKLPAYPVASRVNKSIIVEKVREEIGPTIKKWLRKLY